MSLAEKAPKISEKAVHMMRTPDPAAALDDLGWLDDVVGDARIVAIGESSHFNAESYLLRHRIFRYLVERHGFTAFVMESGYAEGALVDRWVKGEDSHGLAEVMTDGFTYQMGLWTQMRAQLEWMREHNRQARPRISFHGMDVPGSAASLLPALDAATGYLRAVDPEYAVDPAVRAAAEPWAGFSSFSQAKPATFYANADAATKNVLTAGLARLVGRLRTSRLEYVERTSATEFDRALRSAELAAAFDQMWSAELVSMMRTRDSAMADTVRLLAGQEERIVVAAHNGHVQRWRLSLSDPPATPLGMFLADVFGADYRVIGTTMDRGQVVSSRFLSGPLFVDLEPAPADTLDGVMAATADEVFGVDLRTLSPADIDVLRGAKQQRALDLTAGIDAVAAYDALIHLPVVTAATPDPDALMAAPDEVQDRLSDLA